MNREKLEEWLKDISTPTGLSYSGDRTLSNSEADCILEYVDDLEEVKKIYDTKYRENKMLKEQILLYKTIINSLKKELELNLKFKVIGVKRLQDFINNLLEEKND